jgi:hypothetical protein
VTFISTYHNGEMSTISKDGKEIIKPKVALDYNTNMVGVDLRDQILQPYLLAHKNGNKWYIKFFKRLLNVAVHNTMVRFRATAGNQKLDHLSFKQALIKGLIETHGPAVPSATASVWPSIC